ncbi:type II secretion system F family protein [Halalkalibacter alkaliphilus]|uniref:Type II secretion system F family protein n=1 Tax=Halalkalibacter alkaliphilus TaxID=2917993 RepID=A0A9X2CR37_9BACI|nr:type II secretion system F family protein [Halalkalibacter alkaliphilus]MCL7746726.1 type II secretion system F family protein [Halalkalibacter alkaliphilus]
MTIVIFMLSTLSFALCGTYFFNKQQKIKKRIHQFIPNDGKKVKLEKAPKPVKKVTLKSFLQQLSKNIKTTDTKRSQLEIELESAGLPLKVEEFITIRVVIFGFAFCLTLLMGIQLLLAIVFGLLAWKLPTFYLKKKKSARIAASAAQLPQVLEIMANSMKSGFSFMQAMQLVSREMPDPIGIEFQRTIKEINLGISTEEAFENLLQRLPNKDLEIVVTAVLIQRSTGGNLAVILETIQETITERVRMKDELKALTSQGRMSALVITLLPVILGLLLNVMNPDYFSPMFSHPLGLVLLGGGIFSGLLGWIFIQKVVTIEV